MKTIYREIRIILNERHDQQAAHRNPVYGRVLYPEPTQGLCGGVGAVAIHRRREEEDEDVFTLGRHRRQD